MISIIVCSGKPEFVNGMQESVKATIGVEYEWLIWDNKDRTPICEVYNHMAAKARYPYLCFMHDDLLFNTPNWGQYLLNLFAGQEIGVLGIAGSSYKSKYLSGWYSGGGAKDYSHIMHRDGDNEYKLSFPSDWGLTEPEVVCVDGVFIFCRQQIWEKVKFNETLLRGFHYYDIDFSVRASRFTRVVVTNKIDIVHLTVGGDFGDKWVKQTFIYHNQEKTNLPVAVGAVVSRKADIPVVKYWLDYLKNQPVSFSNRMRWVLSQHLYLNPVYWYSIAKFFLYQPLGLKYVHRLFKKK